MPSSLFVRSTWFLALSTTTLIGFGPRSKSLIATILTSSLYASPTGLFPCVGDAVDLSINKNAPISNSLEDDGKSIGK